MAVEMTWLNFALVLIFWEYIPKIYPCQLPLVMAFGMATGRISTNANGTRLK